MNDEVGNDVQQTESGTDQPVQQETPSVDQPQVVALDYAQWQQLQSYCGYSLGLSLVSLLLCGCIFGAILSHYLGRAINRG